MRCAFSTMNLTARTYHKVLKVARTIADLDGEEQIGCSHLKEALGYRMLDKKILGEVMWVIYEYWFARMKNISDSKKKKTKRGIWLCKKRYII